MSGEELYSRDVNELCVAVVRAKGLSVSHRDAVRGVAHALHVGHRASAGLGDGWANPLVRVTMAGAMDGATDGGDDDCLHDVSTAVQSHTVAPVFKEVFFLKLEDPPRRDGRDVVRFSVYDQDQAKGEARYMSHCDVAVNDCLDRQVHRRWLPLSDGASDHDCGSLEVVLMLRFNPDLDLFFDPHQKAREAATEAARRASLHLVEVEERRRRETVRLEAQALRDEAQAAAEAAAKAKAEDDRRKTLRKKFDGPVALRKFDDSIFQAVADGDSDFVRAYLERAAAKGDLKRCLEERGSSRGRGLLHVAAMTGQNEVMRLLVEDYGANVGIRSLLGRDTPLHLAAQHGHRYTCFTLIQYGAEADLPNKFGATPLHYATKLSIIRLLLRHGARVTEEDDAGRTPLACALENDAPDDALKELYAVKADQDREKYFASLNAEKEKQRKYDAAIAARIERMTRAAREEKINRVRKEYLQWRTGQISGNEIIIIREKRKQRALRWESLTSTRREKLQGPKSPEKRAPAVIGTTADGKTVGSTFGAGFKAFASSAWKGNSAPKGLSVTQARKVKQLNAVKMGRSETGF